MTALLDPAAARLPDALPAGLALIDAPEVDSVVAANRQIASARR